MSTKYIVFSSRNRSCLSNSLVAHIDKLRIILDSTEIDILCINETKLAQTIGDHEVCLPGFDIVGRDRSVNGRHGGGVCIYIQFSLNYKVRSDLQSHILENFIVEIIKPRSKSTLVSTWYRLPDSPAHFFVQFEKMVGSLDGENLEFFILGDLNVNLDQSIESSNKNTLNEIFDIYGLDRLIQEPTRVTESSSSLIDLCLTNNSGVTHLSISDHSLIYVVRKAYYVQTDAKMIEARTMRNFNSENFLNDLNQQPWAVLIETIDKHAPIRIKRVGKKNSPWVTGELRRLLFERDSLKKRAAKSGDASLWHQYKRFRNRANNEMINK